ncbi:MAG: (Fe-S)-binding protein, partial [Candidatus Dormibacteraeota bacterium]|nr:(Fe-S)-binding protein [Candidatus Dormibacteraeota bacterium]
SECNKCSLCQATCPAYVTNPVEWETARGRVSLIRDAIEGRLELRDIADGPLSTCLTCDNCVAACAPRVPTGHIVSRARQELYAQQGHPWGQTLVLRSILPRPGAMRFLHGAARFVQVSGIDALARRTGLYSWFGKPGAFAEHTGPLERQTAYRRARSLPPASAPVRGRVGFLTCCYSNLATPAATEAAMRVLLANGFDVTVPTLGCSGMPARSLGDRDAMQEMAITNAAKLSTLEVDAFVGDVAACVGHYQEYGDIAGTDRQVGATASRVAGSSWLTSRFLEVQGWRAELGPLRWTVAVDEPCSLPVDGPERGSMRRLLELVPNLRLVGLNEAAMCCGGAGSYFARMPERSAAILERKFDNIRASGAGVVVTENVSCLSQLRAGAKLHAPEVRVMHVMELLWESISVAARRRAVLPE